MNLQEARKIMVPSVGRRKRKHHSGRYGGRPRQRGLGVLNRHREIAAQAQALEFGGIADREVVSCLGRGA